MRKVALWAVSADPPALKKHGETFNCTRHRLSYRFKDSGKPSARIGFRPHAVLSCLNERQSRYGVTPTSIALPASSVSTVAAHPYNLATIVSPMLAAVATTSSTTPSASSSSVLGVAPPTQDLGARTLTSLYGLEERTSKTLRSTASQQPWTISLRPLTDLGGLVLRLHLSRAILLIGGLAMSPRSVTDHASPDSSVASQPSKLATNVSVSLASSTKISSAFPAHPASSHPASASPPQDLAVPASEALSHLSGTCATVAFAPSTHCGCATSTFPADCTLCGSTVALFSTNLAIVDSTTRTTSAITATLKTICAPLILSISLRSLWLCKAPRVDRLIYVLSVFADYLKGIVIRLHRSKAPMLFGGLATPLLSIENF